MKIFHDKEKRREKDIDSLESIRTLTIIIYTEKCVHLFELEKDRDETRLESPNNIKSKSLRGAVAAAENGLSMSCGTTRTIHLVSVCFLVFRRDAHLFYILFYSS